MIELEYDMLVAAPGYYTLPTDFERRLRTIINNFELFDPYTTDTCTEWTSLSSSSYIFEGGSHVTRTPISNNTYADTMTYTSADGTCTTYRNSTSYDGSCTD